MTLHVTPAQAALLRDLCSERRSFVVVGAAALLHHVALPRTTNDLDLAIVADEAEIASILSRNEWTPDRGNPFRWSSNEEILDVIPATPERIREGRIEVGDGREFSLVGFDLALRHTISVPLLGTEVPVATLPAIVLLKMVAWLDRPYERVKDLGDLARVLDRALDDYDPRRWESPLAEVAVEDQSAFFVGRSVREIAMEPHLAEVERFLRDVGSSTWTATLAQEGGYLGQDPEAMAARRLAAFGLGLAR